MGNDRDWLNDQLRRALLVARDLAAQGESATVAYLIEAALDGLNEEDDREEHPASKSKAIDPQRH